MSRLMAKRRQKSKARERRVAQEKLQQADQQRYAQAFPQFVLRANNTPEARQQSRQYLENTGDFSLAKWFHDQGVPQAIQTEKAFYADRI
jgi:hypothetical protein